MLRSMRREGDNLVLGYFVPEGNENGDLNSFKDTAENEKLHKHD